MNQVQGIISEIMQDYSPVMDNWKQHNCPACVHRGQSRPDSRNRGNHLFSSDGSIAYNCFNCHLKAVWAPGSKLSRDMESLLSSYGASSNQMMKLSLMITEMIESGLYEKDDESVYKSKVFQRVMKRELPSEAKSFNEWVNSDVVPEQFIKVLERVNERNPYLLDLELYWTPEKKNYLHERFIIPYYMNGTIIGYTARNSIKESEYRYFNQVSTQLFYNFDLLNDDKIKIIFVAEGPLDAALMGGVSVNNNYLSQEQIKQLQLASERGKRIVIVPDRDPSGKDSIKQALKYGFEVSLPDFGTVRNSEGIRYVKDFEEASKLYGRLFCLQMLHNSIHSTPFDIEVHANKWI